MPQGKKKYADFDAVTKPRKYADFDKVAPPKKYSDFDAVAQPETLGTLKNLQLGAEEEVYGSMVPSALSGLEALGSAMTGDFKPAGQIVERAARGVGQLLLGGNPSFAGAARANNAAIQRIAAEQQDRRQGDPVFGAVEKARQEVEAEASVDQSRRGRFTRGVGRFATAAAPAVITGALTGGSAPAVAAVSALQSLDQPENLAINVAQDLIPVPLFRRVRGVRARAATAAIPESAPVTQRLPQLAEEVRPTQRLPRADTYDVETTPTVELRARSPLPVRERIDSPPDLYAVEAEPFGVRANLNAPREYPGARGPRMAEAQREVLTAQAKAVAPPVKPPSVDDELGRLWSRRPEQAALFDAAAKSPWQDSVLAYYRANLLTNPVGRALDLASTSVNQFADAAVRPIAAAADVIVSKLTGKRSITGPSLQGTGRAFGSIRQGLRDAREVMKTGRQTIDSGADDVLYGSEIRTGLGKGADVPINGVFRVLGAMDAPFRRFGFVRNLHDRARAAAINESRRGIIPRNQIDARAAQLVDRGDIIEAAVRDGERAVLSEPNRISSWLSRQTANSPNARLAIGIVQPFMRIPLNAILRSADFAGIGGVKALYKIARGGARRARGESFFRNLEEQRVFAQNVAAGSFAPAAFILGMALEESGELEGYYYTSKKDYPNGRVPTSINIDGERYDVNRLGGFIAAPLFIGATYSRLRREGSDQANALLRSFSGLAQQAPALGFYGAPAKAGRILTADEPGSEIVKEAGSITSGFIPASGAVGAAAKAIDQNRKRETPGFTGPIMSRIPGLRGLLPEKVRATERRKEKKGAK
jgi:hypothetical protein